MIYFTSDLHLGHTNVIKYCDRPFKDSGEMDAKLINNWNDIIKHNDEVYIIGDFTLKSLDNAINYAKRLNGRKYLIKGNHDIFTKRQEAVEGFEWIKEYHKLKINGQDIILFHYPIEFWDKKHHGSIHLHGHSHNKSEYNIKQKEMGNKRYDVGVDANDYRPVSIYEILEWFK